MFEDRGATVRLLTSLSLFSPPWSSLRCRPEAINKGRDGCPAGCWPFKSALQGEQTVCDSTAQTDGGAGGSKRGGQESGAGGWIDNTASDGRAGGRRRESSGSATLLCSDLPAAPAPPPHQQQQQQLQFIALPPLRLRGHRVCLRPPEPMCEYARCPLRPSWHRPRADQRTRTVAADEPRLLPIKVLPHRTAVRSGGGSWPVVMVLLLGPCVTVHLLSPVRLRWPAPA